MRTRLLCLSLLVLLSLACGGGGGGPAVGSEPGPAHATSAGGPLSDDHADVAAFADGSRILTGAFRDEITLGAGEPGEQTLLGVASDDTFVARYGNDGLLVWAKQIEGGGTVRPGGVSTFPDGSCVVTGYFSGDVTFGKGEPNQTSILSLSSTEAFLARFDPDGPLAWAKRISGPETDVAHGVSAFADGSCVVSGQFSGTTTFGPLEANETDLTAGGSADAFVARFNANGTLAWVKQASGVAVTSAEAISAVPDGSCIVTGHYSGNTVFGFGEANQITLPDPGQGEVFVARYNSNGTLAWAKRAGGVEYDVAADVSAFSDGSSVIVGESDGAIVFGSGEGNETTINGPGVYTFFLAHYGPDGTLQWAKGASGTEYHEPYGVSALDDGSCVVVGDFRPDITLGAGESGQTTLHSAGNYDVFVAGFAGDGALRWARRAGGLESDGAMNVTGLAGTHCLVAGTFGGTAVFGTGEVHETSLVAVANRDIFVAHYGPAGDL